MAEKRDELKTVRLTPEEIRETLAEGTDAAEPKTGGDILHDGRFGEKFDDEIHIPSVIWVTVSIAAVTALFFAVSWGLILYFTGERTAKATPPIPVAAEHDERRLPSGPRLQASPEAELNELRREMHEEVHGYGWVDEAAGIVHIPVERAMDLVLEKGLGASVEASEAEEAPASEEESAP